MLNKYYNNKTHHEKFGGELRMRKHIKEHFKAVIGITVLLMCTILFITSNELLAKLLPDASELEFVSATLENEVYEYTGDEILPEISSLSLMNKDGVEVEITSDAFEVVQYLKNTEIGHADIEVSLEGYRNTILCEDIFEIVLGKVKEISVSESEEGKVFLQWEKVPGADTYKVYKSVDKEETNTNVKANGEELSNIVKYSLSNTRVYINIFKENNEVIIVMKNISIT